MSPDAIIWTEGKTDWQHVQRAASALHFALQLDLGPINLEEMGDDQLFKQCKALAMVPQIFPTIFIFDRDKPEIVQKVDDPDLGYKHWGNNVYSLALPVPEHRAAQSLISIEMYYTDEEICTPDKEGRRLYLSSEFNPATGKHVRDRYISIGQRGKLPPANSGLIRIIDSDVFGAEDKNIALPKAAFAACVAAGSEAFAKIDFSPFRQLLSTIEKIVHSATEADLWFNQKKGFLNRLALLDDQDKRIAILETLIRAAKTVCTVYAGITIQYFDHDTSNRLKIEPKRLRLLHQTIIENFGNPSLTALNRLAQRCYHLAGGRGPDIFGEFRSILTQNILLGPLGELLDDLELLFPPDLRQGRRRNRAMLRQPLIEFVFPELAKYESRLGEIGTLDTEEILAGKDPSIWMKALTLLIETLAPLSSFPFRLGAIDRFDAGDDEVILKLTVYKDKHITTDSLVHQYSDLTGDQLEICEVGVSTEGEQQWINVLPFVRIYDDTLYAYSRTRSVGYEYRAVHASDIKLVATKKKFSHTALGSALTSDRQQLFWARVAATQGPAGILANIPVHDPAAFIGRRQQIKTVVDEIVRIPNQHGLIYGPGGVGKTALLIELSRKIYEGELTFAPPYRNIIWISAKQDYYDPKLDLVEVGTQQFRSLDQILTEILTFNGFEDADEYNREEREWLVLEILHDDKTMLILDNFETVPEQAQKEIIRFFGVKCKQHLIAKPDNCKVLITSREIIPSGFHQIGLKGLDKRDSKRLMAQLFEAYRGASHQPLTEMQMEGIYEATKGIPLIIKHCYGQVFEYSRPLDSVLEGLSIAGNKVVEFSFAEIFELLKNDEHQRAILVLLQLVKRPLLPRHIADMLSLDSKVVDEKLGTLTRYQCVIRDEGNEKFLINPEVKLLATSLAQQNTSLEVLIRQRVAEIAADKQLDYSQQEFQAFSIFQKFLDDNDFLEAEDFIKEQLATRPNSIVLNLHYAKYLKEVRGDVISAIERLEAIRERSGNHPHVLQLLIEYYLAIEPQDFDKGYIYANELEQLQIIEDGARLAVAKFYTEWSTKIKARMAINRLDEGLRQERYKGLATRAITMLNGVSGERTHEWYFLLAQCQFNRWDNTSAMRSVEQALGALPSGSQLRRHYEALKESVVSKWSFYQRRARGPQRTY
jgi:hypothetical protein